jgi:hypothetical protein
MPCYFFDIDNGEQHARDDEGLEFADQKAARDNAVSALPDIPRDAMPDGSQRDFAVTMRDQSGTAIFRATLSFRTEWLNSD